MKTKPKKTTRKVTAKSKVAKSKLAKSKVVKTKVKAKPRSKLTSKNELLKIRLKNNFTQIIFAKKLGISQSHLCKIERGEQKINIEIARVLHKTFKIPSNKILQTNI